MMKHHSLSTMERVARARFNLVSGKGDDCNNLTKENRECSTIHPFSTFSGDLAMCQIIFAGTGL